MIALPIVLLVALATGSGAAVLREEAGVRGSPIEARQPAVPDSTCLTPDALQTASLYTGLEEGTAGIRPGLAPSKTNGANFINFCSGRSLTNGRQATTGSCNGVPMGRIPAVSNMISAIITHPLPTTKLEAGKTFNISIATRHLRAGFLANPSASYYAAPQDLDEAGDVFGHCHVTIQNLGASGAEALLSPPDPGKFVFFKGIDDAGDGKGGLTTAVEGGLPAGFYRVCTMISARNHQPVVMPIAQRGAVDDCTKFEVAAAAPKKSCKRSSAIGSGSS